MADTRKNIRISIEGAAQLDSLMGTLREMPEAERKAEQGILNLALAFQRLNKTLLDAEIAQLRLDTAQARSATAQKQLENATAKSELTQARLNNEMQKALQRQARLAIQSDRLRLETERLATAQQKLTLSQAGDAESAANRLANAYARLVRATGDVSLAQDKDVASLAALSREERQAEQMAVNRMLAETGLARAITEADNQATIEATKLTATYARLAEVTGEASVAEGRSVEVLGALTAAERQAAQVAADRALAEANLARSMERADGAELRRARDLEGATASQRAFQKALFETREELEALNRTPMRRFVDDATGANRMSALRRQFPEVGETDLAVMASSQQAIARKQAGRDLAMSAGRGIVNTGVGIGALGAVAGKFALDFEASMQRVQANSNMTAQDLEKVKKSVLDLGSQTGAPLDQLGRAYEHAANYGYDFAHSEEIVKQANIAARATGADVGETTRLLGRIMSEFHIPVADAAKAMNVLYLAAAQSDQRFADLISSGGRAYAMADQLKISFQEASAVLSVFARSGISSEEAATQFVNSIQKMSEPTSKVRKEIEYLDGKLARYHISLAKAFSPEGIAAHGVAGGFATVREAAEKLRMPIADLAHVLFPNLRGTIGALIGTSDDGFTGILKRMQEYGQLTNASLPLTQHFTQEQATAQAQLEKLSNQIKQAFLPVGQDFLKILRDGAPLIKAGADEIASLMKAFASLPQPVQEAILGVTVFSKVAQLTGLGEGISLLKSLMTWLIRTSPVTRDAAAAMTTLEGASAATATAEGTAAAATSGLGASFVALAGNPITLLLAALGSVAFAYYRIRDAINNVTEAQRGFAAQAQSNLQQTPIQHAIALRQNLRHAAEVGGEYLSQANANMPPGQTGTDHIPVEALRADRIFESGAGAADLNMILQTVPNHSDENGRYVTVGELQAALAKQQQIIDAYGRTQAADRRRMGVGAYAPFVAEAAQTTGLPEALIRAVIQEESGGHQEEVSRTGAIGLMQLMPGTARGLGVDPRDARQNVLGGSRYLAQMLSQFGNLPEAIAAYNAGPGAVERYHGVPPYRETQTYVRRVLSDYSRFKSSTDLPGFPGVPDYSDVTLNPTLAAMDAALGKKKKKGTSDADRVALDNLKNAEEVVKAQFEQIERLLNAGDITIKEARKRAAPLAARLNSLTLKQAKLEQDTGTLTRMRLGMTPGGEQMRALDAAGQKQTQEAQQEAKDKAEQAADKAKAAANTAQETTARNYELTVRSFGIQAPESYQAALDAQNAAVKQAQAEGKTDEVARLQSYLTGPLADYAKQLGSFTQDFKQTTAGLLDAFDKLNPAGVMSRYQDQIRSADAGLHASSIFGDRRGRETDTLSYKVGLTQQALTDLGPVTDANKEAFQTLTDTLRQLNAELTNARDKAASDDFLKKVVKPIDTTYQERIKAIEGRPAPRRQDQQSQNAFTLQKLYDAITAAQLHRYQIEQLPQYEGKDEALQKAQQDVAQRQQQYAQTRAQMQAQKDIDTRQKLAGTVNEFAQGLLRGEKPDRLLASMGRKIEEESLTKFITQALNPHGVDPHIRATDANTEALKRLTDRLEGAHGSIGSADHAEAVLGTGGRMAAASTPQLFLDLAIAGKDLLEGSPSGRIAAAAQSAQQAAASGRFEYAPYAQLPVAVAAPEGSAGRAGSAGASGSIIASLSTPATVAASHLTSPVDKGASRVPGGVGAGVALTAAPAGQSAIAAPPVADLTRSVSTNEIHRVQSLQQSTRQKSDFLRSLATSEHNLNRTLGTLTLNRSHSALCADAVFGRTDLLNTLSARTEATSRHDQQSRSQHTQQTAQSLITSEERLRSILERLSIQGTHSAVTGTSVFHRAESAASDRAESAASDRTDTQALHRTQTLRSEAMRSEESTSRQRRSVTAENSRKEQILRVEESARRRHETLGQHKDETLRRLATSEEDLTRNERISISLRTSLEHSRTDRTHRAVSLEHNQASRLDASRHRHLVTRSEDQRLIDATSHIRDLRTQDLNRRLVTRADEQRLTNIVSHTRVSHAQEMNRKESLLRNLVTSEESLSRSLTQQAHRRHVESTFAQSQTLHTNAFRSEDLLQTLQRLATEHKHRTATAEEATKERSDVLRQETRRSDSVSANSLTRKESLLHHEGRTSAFEQSNTLRSGAFRTQDLRQSLERLASERAHRVVTGEEWRKRNLAESTSRTRHSVETGERHERTSAEDLTRDERSSISLRHVESTTSQRLHRKEALLRTLATSEDHLTRAVTDTAHRDSRASTFEQGRSLHSLRTEDSRSDRRLSIRSEQEHRLRLATQKSAHESTTKELSLRSAMEDQAAHSRTDLASRVDNQIRSLTHHETRTSAQSRTLNTSQRHWVLMGTSGGVDFSDLAITGGDLLRWSAATGVNGVPGMPGTHASVSNTHASVSNTHASVNNTHASVNRVHTSVSAAGSPTPGPDVAVGISLGGLKRYASVPTAQEIALGAMPSAPDRLVTYGGTAAGAAAGIGGAFKGLLTIEGALKSLEAAVNANTAAEGGQPTSGAVTSSDMADSLKTLADTATKSRAAAAVNPILSFGQPLMLGVTQRSAGGGQAPQTGASPAASALDLASGKAPAPHNPFLGFNGGVETPGYGVAHPSAFGTRTPLGGAYDSLAISRADTQHALTTAAGSPTRDAGSGIPTSVRTGSAGADTVYGNVMTGVNTALGVYGVVSNAAQQGVTVGNVLGGAATGAALGSAIPGIGTGIGAAIGAGLDLIGGLFHHSHTPPQQSENLSVQFGPDQFDYMAYRSRIMGNLSANTLYGLGQLPQSALNLAKSFSGPAPQFNFHLYLDGVKQATQKVIAGMTGPAQTTRSSMYFNATQPIP